MIINGKKKRSILILFVYYISFCLFMFLFLQKVLNLALKDSIGFKYILFSFVFAIVINTLKAFRFYIILLGNEFKLNIFIQKYSETAIISSIIPFKVGDFYRGYCMGNMISSKFDGYIMVICDRFIDTLALITYVFVINFFIHIELYGIYLYLMAFLILIILVFCLFPAFYQYWNHLLIFKKCSKNTLKALKILEVCNSTYQKIKAIVKGRFVILYILSVISWGVEIYMLQLLAEGKNLSNYLVNNLTSRYDVNNLVYTAVCIIFFIIIMGVQLFRRKVKMLKNE